MKKCLSLLLFLCAFPSMASTFYLSPEGSDANTGADKGSPWRTWKFALAGMVAGDTLILLDGTWKNTPCRDIDLPPCKHVSVRINCDGTEPLWTPAPSGIYIAPITIRAQNENGVVFRGDGDSPLFVLKGCSYYSLYGIQLQRPKGSPSKVAVFLRTPGLIFTESFTR